MPRMVTVHWGPVWEVELLKGRMAQEGIPCLLPDDVAPRIEAAVTGIGALATRLQVPEEYAEAAAALVQEYLDAVKQRKDGASDPDLEDE